MNRREMILSTASATSAVAMARRSWFGTSDDKPKKSIRLEGDVTDVPNLRVIPVDGWEPGADLCLKSIHVHVEQPTVALVEHIGRRGGHQELVYVVGPGV